jgi:hypothetical protein
LRRRTVKGGAYDPANNGPYIRVEKGSPLYKLTKTQDQYENNIFEMDFSKVGALASGKMFFTNNDELINLYTDVLAGAYCVGPDSIANIALIIRKLFEGGVAGAKTRTLKITEMNENNFVKFELLQNGGIIEETSIKREIPKFENFLLRLGDKIMPEVMPEGQSKPGFFSRFKN